MINSPELVRLKPHHLLDIFKHYGRGVEDFTAEVERGHDQHRIGNLALTSPDTIVELVIGADDICAPCRMLKDGICLDSISKTDPSSKDLWNQTIDERLFGIMEFSQGEQMSVAIFCLQALELLKADKIAEVWRERPKEETAQRIIDLQAGLEKYAREVIR